MEGLERLDRTPARLVIIPDVDQLPCSLSHRENRNNEPTAH